MLRSRAIGVCAVCIVVASLATMAAQTRLPANEISPATERYRQIIASRGKVPDAERLAQLIDVYERAQREMPPPTESLVDGEKARWVSPAAAQTAAKLRAPIALQAVQSISEEKLPPAAKLDWRFMAHLTKSDAQRARFPTEYLAPWAVFQGVGQLPYASIEDYEEMLAWLRGAPFVIAESLETMKRGIARGITASRTEVQTNGATARRMIAANPMTAQLLTRFRQFPASVPPDERQRLTEAALAIYRTSIGPAYARMADFLETEYLSASNPFPAMSVLPNGPAWYAAQVSQLTGSELSPERIHTEALSDIRRAQREVEALAKSTGFSNYLEFVSATLAAPQCPVLDEGTARTRFQTLMQQVEQQLPKLFVTIPKNPFEIVPVAEERTGGGGFRLGPRPGSPSQILVQIPYVNGGCDFVTVMLHEALPGHALQHHIELESPTFSGVRRRFGGWRAFSEGWANYAMGLAAELGLKLDAYTRAAQLRGYIFMAARTVVETGIHYRGWSRAQAIDYYRTTIPWAPPHTVEQIIDGAAETPGTYLAYFVGQQKIAALRALAERQLGSRFDVRRFHDEVLRNGPMPLNVLDAQIGDWVADQMKKPAIR